MTRHRARSNSTTWWWRQELQHRAGLTWNGSAFVRAALDALEGT